MPGVISRLLIKDLKRAVLCDELYMVYQPQFNHENKMFGAEALLRWNHPIYGNIYPPLIIKLAEEADVLIDVEKYVFAEVRKDIINYGYGKMKISINSTVISLQEDNFVDYLIDLYKVMLDKGQPIYIEITEQRELLTENHIISNLEKLQDAGFKFAIDDFGMGHTSLKYLQINKFDLVKLDGSITRSLMKDKTARDIVDSIVHLSNTAGFSVLAEYVETNEQKNKLEEMGCCEYQGYLYSPPVPASELIKK